MTTPGQHANTVERLADTVREGFDRTSIPPLDCTGDCGYAPCNCSGVFRLANDKVEPARAALDELAALAERAGEARTAVCCVGADLTYGHRSDLGAGPQTEARRDS